MATVTPSRVTSLPDKPASPSKPTRPNGRPSYAPVFLAALVVTGIFAFISLIIATDDVAAVVRNLVTAGWIIAGSGSGLLAGLVVRRGRSIFGLGFISAGIVAMAGLAIIVAAPSFTGPAHTSQAQQAFSQQNYERAITEFRQASNSEYFLKEIPAAYLRWGEQFARAGEFQKALEKYDLVLSKEFSPNTFAALIPEAKARIHIAWAEKIDTENARAWPTMSEQQKTALENELLARYDAAIELNPAAAYANPARSGARNVLYRQAEELKADNKYQELDALYQKIGLRYLDGKPQSQAELELRQASNYLEWGRRLSLETSYNDALDQFYKAETRFARYDPKKEDTVIPDTISNYSKLAPQLINAGKYDEAIDRLNAAVKAYGPKDSKKLVAQALLNSFIEYGKDLEGRLAWSEAITRFKTALDLTSTYKLTDERPKQGLGRVYLAQAVEVEQKNDFQKAIALYRDGLKTKYFSPVETNTAQANISRSYFSWAQQIELSQGPEQSLAIYREGITTSSFDQAGRTRALDAGGDIFMKQGAAAEQRNDLLGALNVYNMLAGDAQFKNSAAGRNLINVSPRVMFQISDQYIKEAGQGDTLNTARLVDARTMLQNLVNSYGSSEFATRARALLTAQVEVVGRLLNNQDQAVGNRPVQFSTGWKFCTASTPTDDKDCQGKKEGFVATGEVLGINTAADGGWIIKLNPNKTYLVSWQEQGGKWASAFTGTQGQPGVLIKVEPMLPVKYEYRTPTDAPA